jgi:hypothetical protein
MQQHGASSSKPKIDIRALAEAKNSSKTGADACQAEDFDPGPGGCANQVTDS